VLHFFIYAYYAALTELFDDDITIKVFKLRSRSNRASVAGLLQ